MKRLLTITAIGLILLSCNRNQFEHDASGTFEATEIIVSAEATGKIEVFNITEGDILTKDQYLGYIDTTQLYLKKLQLQATTKAITVKRPDISLQIAATKDQIVKAELDKKRIESMFGDGAATQKQVDDVNSQLAVLKSTLGAQLNTLSTSVNSIDKESGVYEIQVAQIEDQLVKSRIVNPIGGTVLNKYAEVKEMTSPGKPLYRIADTKHLFLRAYIVSNQLGEVKIGQAASVYINTADGAQKSYNGTVSWISDKAEFTPKTIQTQDERQNLVYAIKIAVENTDGMIKIGMYGDVNFNEN